MSLQLKITWLAHRSSQHVLSVKISNKVAIGHAQLPQAVLQSLKLRHHGRLRLQSVALATQLQASSITLHPMPCTPASTDSQPNAMTQQSRVTEELSQQDLTQLLAAWLAAQASILGTGGTEEHVPVQQCTVVQLTAGTDARAEQQQSMAFKLYMKQPPSLRADPLASYALLSAADLAPSGRVNVSQGGPVIAAPEWALPPPASVQLHEQQAAMLSSSEALHTAASCALKHLLPLLAFSCRYQPPACQACSFALLLEACAQVHILSIFFVEDKQVLMYKGCVWLNPRDAFLLFHFLPTPNVHIWNMPATCTLHHLTAVERISTGKFEPWVCL